MPESTVIGAGTSICENVRIGPNVTIGKHCIICFGASIGHDVVIEDYSFIGERVILSGAVHVGEGALVGIGAVVTPRRSVGACSSVMAQSAVCHDVPERHACGGVPAVDFGPTSKVRLI